MLELLYFLGIVLSLVYLFIITIAIWNFGICPKNVSDILLTREIVMSGDEPVRFIRSDGLTSASIIENKILVFDYRIIGHGIVFKWNPLHKYIKDAVNKEKKKIKQERIDGL